MPKSNTATTFGETIQNGGDIPIKKRPSKLELRNYSVESSRIGRTTSLWWDAENDPFQVFEVEHEACFDLEVVVKNGEKITKGFYKDLIDIPDPYVVLRIPGSSNPSKRTSHIDNNVNPIWNESFHFFLDPKKEHTIYITLMDANHITDELLGTESIDISSLVQNVPSHFTLEYAGGSKVYIVLTLQVNKNPDLRFSLSLCEEEKEFLRQRRLKVLLNMQNLLGDKAPKSKNEVPIIAVLGSGGGFRAMTCFSAAVKALHQSGILGCSTYISGLSGSSWFISTLYAHENFPNITYDEIYEEMKASVTQNWKWNLMHCYRYILDMMDKSRKGQPVSFTDIFGHLLGDVLLKGKKDKKLSDQRGIVAGGKVPLPLYTCLHAKASVSCRAFSEWIEFSPFEIGIAKYGTFMKTEYFGSKFLVGKLIKQFPEFPLHYLQGVWGSAFTILMKRLAFDGGSKQDLVQMMRDATEERAINEMLEDQYLNHDDTETPAERESDTDDEVDIEGADDKSSEDEQHVNRTLEEDIAAIKDLLEGAPCHSNNNNNNRIIEEGETKPKLNIRKISPSKNILKGFSFDFIKRGSFDLTKSQDESRARKASCPTDSEVMTNMDKRKERLKRAGAIKGQKNSLSTEETNYWTAKRTQRRTLKERKPTIIQSWMKNSGVLNSRAGRAGEILNPFRGLSLKTSFPLSPFSNSIDDEEEDSGDIADMMDIGLGCRYKPLDNNAKKLFIVDSGLAFNSPFPLLLRPQRAVDMYLSFDFSQRPSDRHMPFKELLLAEKWARQNQVTFPPVEKLAREFSKDIEVKELYVFKDADDPFCPVILHFTIVNNRFKWNKAPGVPRETTEEIDFANFSLFDDPNQPFASTNFLFDSLQYERLFKLIEYNTLISIEKIKEEIAEVVQKKREMAEKSAERMFMKMQKVMTACRKFQRTGNMSLRVNEAQRKQFILACKAANVSGSVSSGSCSDVSSPIFFDAQDNFEDEVIDKSFKNEEKEKRDEDQNDNEIQNNNQDVITDSVDKKEEDKDNKELQNNNNNNEKEIINDSVDKDEDEDNKETQNNINDNQLATVSEDAEDTAPCLKMIETFTTVL